MNIIVPWSITDNNVYSYSEIVYLSAYLKLHGLETKVRFLKVDEIETIGSEWLEKDSIFIIQFFDKEVLSWLILCNRLFTGKKILYGLSAQVYRQGLAEDFDFDFIVPTNSYESILLWLTKQEFSELPHTIQEIQSPDYNVEGIAELPYIPIISSRGCKNSCSFCAIACANKFTGRYIFRSAESIFEELQTYNIKYNKKRFYFVDSCFIFNDETSQLRAKKLAQMLRASKMRIKFSIETRADCVNKSVFSDLKEAGLSSVLIGVENLNSNVLDRYKKQITMNHIVEAINVLTELRIHINLTMILFDPFTTREEMLDNIKGILDHELYKHLEVHTVFRKLILIPQNKLDNCERINYLPCTSDSFKWYDNTVNYRINDETIQCLSESMGKFHANWLKNVDRYVSQVKDIKMIKEIRIKRKKTLFMSIKDILERNEVFTCIEELVHELCSAEQKYVRLEGM